MFTRVSFALAVVGILAIAAPLQATVYNVNGSNGITDGWGDGTPNYATDTFLPGVSALSGNASLVYESVVDDPGRGIDVLFATPLTGQVSFKYNLYIPAASDGAFFVAAYLTDAAATDLGSWGGTYLQGANTWMEEWNYGVTSQNLVRDAWQEIEVAVDLDAGTMQYLKDGVASGAAVGISPATEIAGFGLPFREDYMGTAFTGPVYLDDFSVVHNGTTVWSENFDSYIVPEPSSILLLATGLLGLIAYAWRKRKS